jgi:AraC-like DNA-binding protein/ligand-binding sensor protein
METSFQSSALNGVRRGDQQVFRPVATIADRNPPARHSPNDFISPASPRLPVVHEPRWLPDNSVTSQKPIGCPARLAGTPSDREVRDKKADLELLKAIVNSSIFKEFEHAFTEATGLPVALRPVESFQLSFHNGKNQGPFCTLMARENRTCGACLRMQAQAAETAVEKSRTTVCYAGLCETVVPLRLGKRLIGYLWTGQTFLSKPNEPKFRRVAKLLASWGMKLDQKVLREAYFQTRVVSNKQHAAAAKLLGIFAEHLAMMSNQILLQRENAEPPMISRAKNFIRDHYAENLRLSQVARFVNTSPFYFCKLFKRNTGLNFCKYLSLLRIESSKHLLNNPQLRVSEIAYDAGFQSLTHFNRVFRNTVGQSPTEYRHKTQNGDSVTRR